jgi:hypothetical protein
MAKFELKDEWIFEAPVVVREPGTGNVFDFVGRFKVLAIPEDGAEDRDLVEAFIGWRGIAHAKSPGGELAETAENRALVIRQPHVRRAIVAAYLEEVHKAAEKNAARPDGAGRPAAVN